MLQPGPLELTELAVLNELQRLVFKNPSVTDASRREHQRNKKQSLPVCRPSPQIFHSFGWWSEGWRVNSSHSRTDLLTFSVIYVAIYPVCHICADCTWKGAAEYWFQSSCSLKPNLHLCEGLTSLCFTLTDSLEALLRIGRSHKRPWTVLFGLNQLSAIFRYQTLQECRRRIDCVYSLCAALSQSMFFVFLVEVMSEL